MRRLALVVALTTSMQAVAAPPQRSLLSGVGVGLIGLGVGALGLGVGQFLSWSDAQPTVRAYAQNAPSMDERFATKAADDWSRRTFLIGLVSGITGAVLVALVLDRPADAVSFFVTPTSTGGALGLTGRF
jgi:hypothetical protein